MIFKSFLSDSVVFANGEEIPAAYRELKSVNTRLKVVLLRGSRLTITVIIYWVLDLK